MAMKWLEKLLKAMDIEIAFDILEKAILLSLFLCFAIMTFASVFVWHNFIVAILFGIITWRLWKVRNA